MLPGKNLINLGALAAFAGLTVAFVIHPSLGLLIAVTAVALALGWHLVASIGGGDMPVVVSMLNSYSGWAAAAAGFLLNNDLLIITGALVGSSGAYLSYIMCQAMNRSFISVIAGGFGSTAAPSPDLPSTTASTARSPPVDAAELLKDASSVIITPGYGMAVAQAQYPVADLTRKLRERGHQRPVRHPPGRRPAARPHERAARRGQGALRHRRSRWTRSTTTSPTPTSCWSSAPTTRSTRPRWTTRPARSPACRCCEVWEAEDVIVFKRSMNTGYAGVQNPLFFRENTQMLFGDAKERVEDIIKARGRSGGGGGDGWGNPSAGWPAAGGFSLLVAGPATSTRGELYLEQSREVVQLRGHRQRALQRSQDQHVLQRCEEGAVLAGAGHQTGRHVGRVHPAAAVKRVRRVVP